MEPTWHIFVDHLTPEQIAVMRRCDANPNHPDGPEGHRKGMLVIARMYGGRGQGA
ncbi:MAG: hypothetical protein U1C73_06920 [Dietzia sp.]|nr:hypothetical protein [Dietzia sp.]